MKHQKWFFLVHTEPLLHIFNFYHSNNVTGGDLVLINDDDNFVIDAANILYAAHNLGKPEYAKTVPNKTDTELILKQMCRSFMKSGGKYHFVFKTPNWHTVLDFYGLKWSKVNVKYDGAVYWYSNKK